MVWPNGQYGLVIRTPRKSRRANLWLLTLSFVLCLGERFEKYAYFNGSVYYPKVWVRGFSVRFVREK